VLAELHHLGVINLRGFVANLDPPDKRARFLRGIVNNLGLNNIPIGRGSPGQDKEIVPYPHEFKVTWIGPETEKFPSGNKVLEKVFKDAEGKYKIALVLLSSLRDIAQFVKSNPACASLIENVNMQGGYVLEPNLPPDKVAANNAFDVSAAETFNKFLWDNKIPSTAWAKGVGMVSSPNRTWVADLEKTKHTLAKDVYKQWYDGLEQLYKKTINPDASGGTAGLKGMTREFFINRFAPLWHKGYPAMKLPKQTRMPKDFKELAQYIDVVSTQ
jgi:inosine-uridine nucleoside N-ribohydrolase